MILGIGTDVVDISRIEQKVLQREGFCQLVFSGNEIIYCDKVKNRFESYAARFAAKEALLKALGTGLYISSELNEIEIENTAPGKPIIKISDELNKNIKKIFMIQDFQIHVSLSHTSTIATAFVIIESEK
jgi:holo-[acyl-carrier protein] synthase